MINLKDYKPHNAQKAFHYAIDHAYRYVAMVCGIRGGKTYSGCRAALKQAWNSKEDGIYAIVAPTYNMLKRTTWREFKLAAQPLIRDCNETDKIITLKNGREVHGFSADKPDRIRNCTAAGFWIDEGRECPSGIWDIMLGRVLSTNGRGILTTSPNSFDWIHETFVENTDPEYGIIHFSTYDNTYLKKEAIDSLARKYDPKFAEQELGGKFVVFEGQVYYSFSRHENAGDIALRKAQYNPYEPLRLCCDFNISPMFWVLAQYGVNQQTGLREVYFVDEVVLKNSNTVEACQEIKNRYPNHNSGIVLYGDASGRSRHTNSHVSDWNIIHHELADYNITDEVPRKNPAEKDRINAMNGMLCNSKKERHVLINPNKCKRLIKDLEQVAYKEGSTQIDKNKDINLTHGSDAAGYLIERDFSLARGQYKGLRI